MRSEIVHALVVGGRARHLYVFRIEMRGNKFNAAHVCFLFFPKHLGEVWAYTDVVDCLDEMLDMC